MTRMDIVGATALAFINNYRSNCSPYCRFHIPGPPVDVYVQVPLVKDQVHAVGRCRWSMTALISA